MTKYFVSFSVGTGFGNCDIRMRKLSMENIRETQENIARDLGLPSRQVAILSI